MKGIRPEISSRWNSTELLRSFYKLMSECWHQDSSVRLTALRVKKSLSRYVRTCQQNIKRIIFCVFRLESDILNPAGAPLATYP